LRLFTWCIDQLPYFDLPRFIELRSDLPRSPVGRVLKRELRDEAQGPQVCDSVIEVSGTNVGSRSEADRSAGDDTVTGELIDCLRSVSEL
jgi:hypothetical protein